MVMNYYLLELLLLVWLVGGILMYSTANSLYPKNIAADKRKAYFKDSIINGSFISVIFILVGEYGIWLLKITPEFQTQISLLYSNVVSISPVWLLIIVVGSLSGYILGEIRG